MNEQRNLILALVLSAVVFLGWVLISDRYFPTANKPATQIVKGKTVPLPSATPVPNSPTAARDRNMVLAESPRVKIETPLLAGSINLKGARHRRSGADHHKRDDRQGFAADPPPLAGWERRRLFRRLRLERSGRGAARRQYRLDRDRRLCSHPASR